MRTYRIALLLFTSLCLSQSILANDQPTTYDRISFSVNAMEEVENDTLVAQMFAEREGTDIGRISKEVNRLVGQAVAKAKKTPNVLVQTLEYRTTPVYRKQTLSSWRARQSIRLKSRDATVLAELIGKLQDNLGLGNVSYTISPENRTAAENRLITQAIEAFKQRAQLVSGVMDRPGYRVVRIDVNSAGISPRRFEMRAMALDAKAAPPTLEAGSQRVQVTVNGEIELFPEATKNSASGIKIDRP